ncbi:SnoaL_2 domain-containing protein [Cephalotus follicularis]|uniref:SnoaL_2 domain-containing protein n=1 Tax=Cephalotus follicularis TaxID=3775 RepID=A0A1Q3C7R5_CEPFO|nr:SnoaL_2 domain-containing protein [Cephalotus follicularis]
MAMATVKFSGQAPWQNMCFKAKAGLNTDSLPFKTSCPNRQHEMKIQRHGAHLRSMQAKNVINMQRKFLVMSSDNKHPNSTSSPQSASNMINQFYTYLNDKKLYKLDDYISAHCYFEECSFPTAFEGRQEVMNFLTQLAEGMGKNVKFKIEQVCEGDDQTAAVIWHLEWNNKHIPFTRGCSFFECSIEEDELMIKKARIVIESPIKPGSIVLTLLKNVTALFDEFPKTTDWLLKSPHVIVNFILKIYFLLLAPLISPILSGYIRTWKVMARFLGYILTLVIYIAKKFLK